MNCAICGMMGHIATTCRQKNRPPKNQRMPLADRQCYYCLEKGHFIINCPKRPSQTATSNDDFQLKTSHTANSRGIDTSLSKEAYIELHLGGKKYRCLLENGSDVTLLPASIVYGLPLRPSTTEFRAVNETKIPILGEATVNAKLSGKKIQFTGLDTEYVDELLLGLAWLREQNVT